MLESPWPSIRLNCKYYLLNNDCFLFVYFLISVFSNFVYNNFYWLIFIVVNNSKMFEIKIVVIYVNCWKLKIGCEKRKENYFCFKMAQSVQQNKKKNKKMKIFKSNQKYFATLGITRHQAAQRQPFNAKHLRSFLVFILFVISLSKHLFCEANNFKEYTESAYFTSTSIVTATIFLMFIWRMKFFFNFIDDWEKCVKES